ncbi:contractile injection system tape measure protein [Chitinophaga sancti]|uniref:contractile injection system tape measure protein n=1 Tax=Chitinophaga sancti TaxID=1004 RepID=UPI002A7552B4|nr:contractile injection system tape measure protein [Chitinophaga sancti]WPQ60885.1 contractile injection system tape measure protein [Chitinophaga sancti]
MTFSHKIQQIVMDATFTERELAGELQDRISRVFNQSIEPATATLFNQLGANGESVWIERLELDLGELAYDNFEQQITDRMIAALRDALEGKLELVTQDTGNLYFKDETERLYALLEHYLLTGTLPWWADSSEGALLDEYMIRLTTTTPDRFGRFIIGISQTDYVLRRIVYHFSRHTLEKLITLLEPDQAEFIYGYIANVLMLQQQRPAVKATQEEFEKMVWLFVLTYLVTDNSGQFNRKTFIRRNLEQLAHHFNIGYIRLLYTFRQALIFYKKEIPAGSLAALIRELYEEKFSDVSPTIATTRESVLAYFLLVTSGDVMVRRILDPYGPNVPLPASWIGYDTIPDQSDREEVWQQAVFLITLFLGGESLPYWFTQLQPGLQNGLLQQAVILLYRKRAVLLFSLWEKSVRFPQIRLRMHQLFARPVTPLEEQIQKQLAEYVERDTIRYLQETLNDHQPDSFIEIWRKAIDKKRFYTQVLQAAPAIQRVAHLLREEEFWLLLADAPLFSVDILKEMQEELVLLGADNIERERIRHLFRIFNLQWLGGKLILKDVEQYKKALHDFLKQFDERATRRILQPVTPEIPKKKMATSEQEGIRINNAGLVLLHPFFYTYFNRLQLLQNGKFVDSMAQQRAIRLLQLLVDGRTDHAEHELVLNKILCNYPLEQPLTSEIEITPPEKELAVQLVNAAIQQWEKMKNSSVDSFRASFLQREGLVWQAQDAWFQKVTPRGYDIILQTLPWSYGMIKTSWTDKFFYTEWTPC